MGKTKRHEQRDGEFKKLKASNKKQRNKKQRATKANLQRQLQFASEHRANRRPNMTQLHASMYMDKSTEADFDPSTFNIDPALNDETIETLEKSERGEDLHEVGSVDEMIKELHEPNKT